MRGRKPTPSYLRVLTGNPGKRPLPPDEPQSEGEVGPPPHHLTDVQKDIWREQAEAAPWLSRSDRNMYELWVKSTSAERDAMTRVSDTGLLVKGPNGGWMQNPYLSIANRKGADAHRLGSELGFSPTSRTRVKAKPNRGRGANAKGNPFAGLKSLPED